MFKNKDINFFAGKRIVLIFIPVFIFSILGPLYAGENFTLGSRAASMGNAAASFSDIWAVHHNQAGLAALSSFEVGFHHENRFLMQEFGLQALAVALPARPGTIALSYTYFGFSLYNESKLGLAFGRMFGDIIAAGIQINYLHTYIAEDYGDAGNLTVEGGIIAEPVEGLFIAAHVYNPAATKLKTSYDEPFPTILKFGLSGYLGEEVLAAVEIEKHLDHKAVFKTGAEIGVLESLFLRMGITSDPVQSSFGLGYVFGRLVTDLAFTNHQALGLTPHFTASYIFR